MKSRLQKNIILNNIPKKGIDVSVSFTDKELELINNTRIPEDFNVKSFKSELYFNYLPGGENILRLSGKIFFTVATQCGISLEPMDMDITEAVEIDFSENINTDKQSDETYLLPELIKNGKIDIYDIIIQELILLLPSYAVKENANISSLNYVPSKFDLEAVRTINKNPFSKLRGLGVISND